MLASVLPAAEGAMWAVIVITALPPAASEPSAQVTVCPEALQLPWLAVAAANDSPAGSGSVTLTPVAVLGPLLTNDSVYVTVPPATGDVLDATFFRARSTSGWTSIVAVAWLLLGSGSGSLPDTDARFPTVVPAIAAVVRVLDRHRRAGAARERPNVARDRAVTVVAPGRRVDEVESGR